MKLIKLPYGLYVAVPDYIQAFEISFPGPPQPGNPPILDSIHIVQANDISTKLQVARIAIQAMNRVVNQRSYVQVVNAQLNSFVSSNS